jgi:predicted permease
MRFEHWLYVLPLRIRSLLRRVDVERELDEELRYHLERQIELNVERGMTPDDARRAALLAMGGVEQQKEACRDRRGIAAIDHLARDTRHGLRLLARSPVFTAVAVLSLAIGIGANAAIFQLLDTVAFRRLPVANPAQLAEIRSDYAHDFGVSDDTNSRVTYPLWEQIRTHQTAFESTFAWGNIDFLVGSGAGVRTARGLWVSGDFFSTLGLTTERGRLLTSEDDRPGCGAGPAVVSHAFWRTALGGRESVIGDTLTLHGQPFTVVGVSPARFAGLEVGDTFDVAVPVCAAALFGNSLERRDYFWLTVMGRLGPGWTLERASQELQALSPGILEATVPPGYGGDLLTRYREFTFGAVPAGRGVSRLRDAYRTPLWLLLGLTGLVLLVTCGNLAMLLLARASAREREIAVRAAVGASRTRLVSQMLTESLLVAAGGAALAVPVAVLSARGLVTFFGTPEGLELTTDWRLLTFVGVTAFLTAMLFGFIPALRVSLADPLAAIRLTSRGVTLDRHRARFQRGLVVAQIALSLALIVSAMAFVQTLRNLTSVDTGFAQDGILGVAFSELPGAPLPLEQRVAFQQRLADEIRSVPGVAAAAATTHLPLSWSTWSHYFRLTGASEQDHRPSRFIYVSPGYFETLRIPIRAGRDFDDLDATTARRVMLVNESFVRSHLGGREAVGTAIHTIAEPGYPATTYEIVGVVGDTKYTHLRDEECWCDAASGSMPPIAYVPIAQDPDLRPWAGVVVRSNLPAAVVTSAIAERVTRLDPGIAVQVTDLESQVLEHLATERLMAWLAGTFGVVAVVLVIVGLYGVIAYLAAGRRNEIGIRLSLGSTRFQIVRLVLHDSVGMLAAGVIIGLPLAAAVMRGASTLLFGLSSTDLFTMAGATGLLAAVVAMAGGLPAWRAARVDPNVALRCE